jgi:hypothetical protein
MDKEFQTSFVPKKTVIEREVSHTHSSFSGVANLVALIIFIASILSAGAAYFYRGSMEDKIVTYKDSLQRARASFEPALITELQILDKRMRAASEILENHIAVSPIFTLLGDTTLPTVRYSDFSYEFNEENANLVDVEIKGESKGYNFIALQADLLGDNKFIKNPIFSEFTLDQTGNIDFKLTFSVDKSLVLYESFLEREESLGEDFDPSVSGDPFAPAIPGSVQIIEQPIMQNDSSGGIPPSNNIQS